MVNIPNQDIHSIEMIQKYPKSSNGTTVIKYYINEGQFPLKKLFDIVGKYSLPQSLQIEDLCYIEDNFKIQSEGQFFVKASSYQSHVDLSYAKQLAVEDDIRYKLFHNQLNTSICPALLKVSSLLAQDYGSFYQSFVHQTKSLSELYKSQNLLNTSLEELAFKDFLISAEQFDYKYDQETWSNIKHRIEYAFKVFFEHNSNIMFFPTTTQDQANLVIYPILQENPEPILPADLMMFQNQEIQQMNLIFPIPFVNNTAMQINDFVHGLAHIFLDHPCENYYSCNKGSVQLKTPGIEFLSIMSQMATLDISKPEIKTVQVIQSLLPWDIAALRHSYGIPEAKNTTYILNDVDNFRKNFAADPYKDTLVAFSSIGHNIIDAQSAITYTIDLRYDQLSSAVTTLFSLNFLLSYDTEIAEIFVNGSGIINLNDQFSTIINIKNSDYILQEVVPTECVENTYGVELVQIYNYQEGIHHLCIY